MYQWICNMPGDWFYEKPRLFKFKALLSLSSIVKIVPMSTSQMLKLILKDWIGYKIENSYLTGNSSW